MARALSRAGIGRLAVLLGEVGREKIHVIFGRRYHRNTDAQDHTAIATLLFPDVAGFELLEVLVLISLVAASSSHSRLVPRPCCSRRIPSASVQRQHDKQTPI